jgi:hypothetical protein
MSLLLLLLTAMAEIICGFGEIGKAVKEAVSPDALVYDLSMTDQSPQIDNLEIMHICFPYSDKFIQYAQGYIDQWQPEHIAIWSTVPIGVTKQVSGIAVHTPVEGKHPSLATSIRIMTRWVGCNNQEQADFFTDYFKARHFVVRSVPNSDYTEALKLLGTTEYGINLLYADYKKRVAEAIGMDYELTKRWNRDYNQLYRELGLNQFQKFVLDPPGGKLGGHCVRENSILLNEQYPDTLLQRINAMGKP